MQKAVCKVSCSHKSAKLEFFILAKTDFSARTTNKIHINASATIFSFVVVFYNQLKHSISASLFVCQKSIA